MTEFLSVETAMVAAAIKYHVLDFSGMPAAGVIIPGFYYTFASNADDEPEAPGIFLNGPHETFEIANAKALAFLADALTSYQGDEEDDITEDEVEFVTPEGEVDPDAEETYTGGGEAKIDETADPANADDYVARPTEEAMGATT